MNDLVLSANKIIYSKCNLLVKFNLSLIDPLSVVTVQHENYRFRIWVVMFEQRILQCRNDSTDHCTFLLLF